MSWGEAGESLGGFAGAIVGGSMAAKRAKSARAWSKRRYAERYQVTMKDMKKAGLNPMLAAGMGLGGSGAPQAQGSGQEPLGGTINAAREATTRKKGQQLNRDRYEQRERALMESQRYKNVAEGNVARQVQQRVWNESHLLELKFPAAEYEAAMDRSLYGRFFRTAGRALPTVTTGAQVLGALKIGKLTRGMAPARLKKKGGGNTPMTKKQKDSWDAEVRARDAQGR